MKLILITKGISPIVIPFLKSKHTVTGIIEAAPRNTARITLFPRLPWRKTLKKTAWKYNVPYYYMNKGSDSALEEWVKKISLDIIQEEAQKAVNTGQFDVGLVLLPTDEFYLYQ